MSPKKRSSQNGWAYDSRSPDATVRLGHQIGTALEGGEVVALYGDIGTGKTTLVRGMAAGIGAPPQAVTSPTFVLIHEYRGRLRLAHADLYRITDPDELRHTGLIDYFDGSTVVVIEWAERAGDTLPSDRLQIRLSHEAPSVRHIVMSALGSDAKRLLTNIRQHFKEPD
jgi:tRNA threonylcarbamoyladenosine biosynthesis protein TsaE